MSSRAQSRDLKPLHEIKLIDPASGSGNFLLYAFEFFYKLYEDQIDNYGADYDEDDIPQLIIERNLHGIDLDDRAIQLAQLGLWIKAKQKRRSTGSAITAGSKGTTNTNAQTSRRTSPARARRVEAAARTK